MGLGAGVSATDQTGAREKQYEKLAARMVERMVSTRTSPSCCDQVVTVQPSPATTYMECGAPAPLLRSRQSTKTIRLLPHNQSLLWIFSTQFLAHPAQLHHPSTMYFPA